jgi:glucosamine--fructose-6-phosphate aminotransferase (isomerizing)
LAVAEEGAQDVHELAELVLPVPAVHPLLQPVVAVVPLQLLAYNVAVELGHDVDQPRNLAKSVTVE